ncbi:MAG: hypothetical protein KF734_11445 [Saprospiraceae bacterium]|nr:hypothetical protein [Saprospiraceae bacterium]
MPDISTEHGQNAPKAVSEIVAFRYSDEASLMLVGEAEVLIEHLAGTEGNANLYSVRVDILSAFAPDGGDCYERVKADAALRQQLEKTALDHYFHPPKVPVSLPKRISECD